MLQAFTSSGHEKLLPLFDDHKYLRVIIKTILKENIGQILVDDIKEPHIALLSYKVIEFIAGDVSNENALELIRNIPENKLLIFPNKDWVELANTELILNPYPRTKFSSENLNITHLDKILQKGLPKNFTLEKINHETISYLNPKLAPAFLPFFKSPEEMVTRGLGFCIKEDDVKCVSVAAASMPIYDSEFEIQALTDPDKKYRRKGFASIACAALIKEALKRGMTPNWDADNEISAKLALKLGFSHPEPYTAYISTRSSVQV